MLEIFKYHPNSKEKLKNFDKIFIAENFKNSYSTQCFYIGKKDKEMIEISYLKSLETMMYNNM
jgi:hypothetical protein